MTQKIILRLIDGLFVKCEVSIAMLMGIKFHYDMATCRFASIMNNRVNSILCFEIIQSFD